MLYGTKTNIMGSVQYGDVSNYHKVHHVMDHDKMSYVIVVMVESQKNMYIRHGTIQSEYLTDSMCFFKDPR